MPSVTHRLKQLLLESFVPATEIERVRAAMPSWQTGRAPFFIPTPPPHPPPHPGQIESRATWDSEADEWSVRHLDIQSNRLRVRRPPSCVAPASAMLLELAMSDARPRLLAGAASGAAGFRADNIASLELESGSALRLRALRVADA